MINWFIKVLKILPWERYCYRNRKIRHRPGEIVCKSHFWQRIYIQINKELSKLDSKKTSKPIKTGHQNYLCITLPCCKVVFEHVYFSSQVWIQTTHQFSFVPYCLSPKLGVWSLLTFDVLYIDLLKKQLVFFELRNKISYKSLINRLLFYHMKWAL